MIRRGDQRVFMEKDSVVFMRLKTRLKPLKTLSFNAKNDKPTHPNAEIKKLLYINSACSVFKRVKQRFLNFRTLFRYNFRLYLFSLILIFLFFKFHIFQRKRIKIIFLVNFFYQNLQHQMPHLSQIKKFCEYDQQR